MSGDEWRGRAAWDDRRMQDWEYDADRLRSARGMFPDLAARLDAALARYGRSSSAGSSQERGPGTGSADDLDAWLDAGAARLRSGEFAAAGFSEIVDSDARTRAERDFAAARTVAGWAGIELPEPEAFAAAGIDLVRLGERLAADPDLVAVPAPFGLGREAWDELFVRAAERFPTVLTGQRGLALSQEAEREFTLLDQPAAEAVIRVGGGVDERGTRTPSWTLRLIPASPAPPLLGLGFAHGPHVTLPEMLMLQLSRLADGESDPLDSNSFTWLAHPLGDGKLGARHIFDDAEGVVRVSTRGVFNQGPHMGARQPVS
ncbi:hypothetical protein K8P10_001495 [Leucobacter sp. Psy1]|uniref:hypothetical protein n=1 Tax=Leucobacter sp. Psy1 TaxID=2875729 RepID=UPI001CD3406F|nr:hypothetical protein [Leucobacter sp. Psy1]UBH05984.1 hypothetical protein K8P10_001495 [Leucobacter sp. Psy1]